MSRPFRRCRHRAADADRGRLRAADDPHHAGDDRHRAAGGHGTSSLRGRRRRCGSRHRRRRRDHGRRRGRRSRHRRHAAEAAATTAEAATITTVAALVAVALAHHHRRLGLVRFDLDGEEAQHLGREAHAPLHLGHGRGRGIDVEQREVRLAALLDLVGEAFDAPVLALGDLAATLLDEVGEFFGQRLDLSVRDVLARQEDMLV